MRIDYSKPSADISKESLDQFAKDQELLARQSRISVILKGCPDRVRCIICNSDLKSMECFKHRSIDYILCSVCGHIQTKVQPPPGYPNLEDNGLTFDQIYPRLTPDEYESRKNRIYRPKLDWILNCHSEIGLNREEMIQSRWVELGCGAGYFLDALRDVGVKNICGLEEDIHLVNIARTVLGSDCVVHYQDTLVNAIQGYKADIYVAFFVLEHIEDTAEFLKSLSKLPGRTVFLFSVKTFGFATVLESCFDNFWARNLDSVIHTQLFTDSSVQYCLEISGFEKKAEWIFGQDATDLSRLLITTLKDKYSRSLLTSIVSDMTKIQDSFQNLLDRHHLSDSRHILAVKRERRKE